MSPLRRVTTDEAGLAAAVAVLRAGGLVALPTETFYGLAAALHRPEALARLSQLKERPADSPLPLLVHGTTGEGGLAAVAAQPLPGRAAALVERFWPGPLTLALPARAGLPPEVVGPDGTIGVRWSPEPNLQRLLPALGMPVTATSANLRGAPPPGTAEAVEQGLGDRIDLLVVGPTSGGGLPSTVVRPEADGRLTLLRRGRLPLPLLEDPDGLSLDALRRGRVSFLQPRQKGLRVTIDPVLLALFLEGRLGDAGPVVDLGTGVGIVLLLLASAGAAGQLVGVELQPHLAALARENGALAGLTGERWRVIETDLRTATKDAAGLAEGAAWVVSNPPQRALGTGRVSPDPSRALACHELGCKIEELGASARELLRPGGSLALIQRGDRERETLAELLRAGFVLRRARRVIARPGRGPLRLLLEATLGGAPGPALWEPELVLHDADGRYCPEVSRWLEG